MCQRISVGVCSLKLRLLWRWRGQRKLSGSRRAASFRVSAKIHSHCFSFSVQTASMFHVQRSWQPTLFLYVFIIQDEPWRNEKEECESEAQAGFHSRTRAPSQSVLFCCPAVRFVDSFGVDASYRVELESKSWRTFPSIAAEDRLSRLLWSLWGSRLSSQRSTARLFNKWWGSRWLWPAPLL